VTAAEQLAERLTLARRGPLLVVTGAGVSLASGIPTFRGSDSGAVWKQDVMEKGTLAFFRSDPVESWRWYLERFEAARGARPNPGHLALAALERWHEGPYLLVTQNVDTLHEQAGSNALVKVHGSVDRFRCARDGCALGAPAGSLAAADAAEAVAAFRAAPARERVPACRECDGPLRPHVLWFDEYYDMHDDYQFHRVRRFIRDEEATVVFVGTSLAVGLTEIVVRNALYLGQPLALLDPGEAPPLPPGGLTHLRAPAEEVLPEVCRLLGAELAAPDGP